MGVADAISRLELDLNVQSGAWDGIDGLEALIGRAARAAAEAVATPGDGRIEVSLLLTSDKEIAALNAAYRGREGPTNVLSFPQAAPTGDSATAVPEPAPARLIGDIVLAYETVDREARTSGKEINDHIAHLVVHGMLHLFGYDHEEDAEAEEMEGLEARILATIGIADPYGGAPIGAEAGTEK